ncbi:MAG: hypothetical protein K8R53_15430, partial [Bacteroidales bacterium]|nr:hypothetical protein [Bacteroidales bacterium]
YRKVIFKLSALQAKSLHNYCMARKTTPTKLIKKSIRRYTEHYAREVPELNYATENQLDLFAEEDNLSD